VRTIRPLVLAGIVTSFLQPAVSANDALDAIAALAPAERHAESWADLRAYAPPAPTLSMLSVLPKTPPRRRPEVFAIPTIAPTPARIPRRFLEQRIVPKTTRLQDELQCLSTAIYFEARGESYLGQVAVAQVILNRVAHPAYPKTICDVVYQASHVHNKCQFSFACDGIADVVREPRAWRWAQRVARSVLFRNNSVFNLRRATNYHATYVSPRWARHMRRLAKIGLHVFYQS
jgi:hypothetical protein